MSFALKPSKTMIAVMIAVMIVLLGIVLLNLKFKNVLSVKTMLSADLDPSCQLQNSSCSLTLPDGGEVTFSINPKPIPLTVPIQLSVRLKGLQASKVEVDFSGVDMNMGFNRTSLQKDGALEFSGETILPVCVRSEMEWEAKVILYSNSGSVFAPFRFKTFTL